MESLSICLSSSPPLQSQPKTHKPITKSLSLLPNSIHSSNPTSHQTHVPSFKKTPHLPPNYIPNLHPNKTITIHPSNPLPNHLLIPTKPSFPQISLKPHLSFVLMGLSAPLSCFASETTVPTEQVSDKINLESILVSIDEFFNRNPFFVAGVTFIWLVVIPLTQEYFKKFKFISAIDAFRKLGDNPNSQLLDIRDKKSLVFLGSPDLKILNKGVVQVQFSEGDEEGFVKKVLGNFAYPENTTICVLDNFDGNSMKVAELLFKNGFKEAYAIKGGVRGKNGWQAIQETLLPPSVHIYPKKKVKMSQQLEMNGGVNQRSEGKDSCSTSVPIGRNERMDYGYINNSIEPTPQEKCGSTSSSPYPNYPDLKPPASPTPSKPRN